MHPAVQNLRSRLREHIKKGGKREDFVRRFSMGYSLFNQYVAGVYEPRKKTVEKMARALEVTYEEMMTMPEEYISNTLDLPVTKQSGTHITKAYVQEKFDDLYDDYMQLVSEGDVEYNYQVEAIIRKKRI